MKKEIKTKETKNKKKVLFVASEAQPFCATGGLADVCGSLPKEIHRLSEDIEIRTIMFCHMFFFDLYKVTNLEWYKCKIWRSVIHEFSTKNV